LGIGTTSATSSVVTPIPSGVEEITSGEEDTCARLTDGSVRCWGYNFFGQLGTGSLLDCHVPTAVVGL
jgi:alpha-tubulin suppressor-like RCC1 family protein